MTGAADRLDASAKRSADAVNTATQPDRVRPRTREWRHELTEQKASYTFPAKSFTVLRFR